MSRLARKNERLINAAFDIVEVVGLGVSLGAILTILENKKITDRPTKKTTTSNTQG